jgi:hypothetical protein
MFHKVSFRSLMVSWLVIGLLAAGCAAPVTSVSKSPGASRPLKVPSLPSLVPTVVQSMLGKATPATKPTPVPTTAPTAAPTLAPTVALTVSAATQPTQTFGTIGMTERLGSLSILPRQIKQVNQNGQDKPAAGNVYVLVTISITNTDQVGTIQFDPATFMIEDAVTHKTYPVVTLKSPSDQLTAQMLKPGARLEGSLAFEVPQATAAKLELELSTASHTLYWTIGA